MRPAAIGFLLLAGALASCSESTYDAAKGERFIRGVVVKQVGAQVATVSCPDDVETKPGRRFTCAVRGSDGSEGDVLVTQRDGDGNFLVNAPFLHVREAEAVMTQQIEKELKGSDVKVACPEIVVVRTDAIFRCKATSGGTSRDVTARLTDARGHFRYRLS
jgi:Domain of unknown function (DUF4333)